MKSYQVMLNKLCDIIQNGLEYKDTIIIGDNSSGKSDVLWKIVKADTKDQLYFIDAVNRYFSTEQIMPSPISDIHYSKEVTLQRLEADTFNYKDSFYYDRAPRAIEDIYMNYKPSIETLMSEFLQMPFEIRRGQVGWNVYVNNECVELSSGYQALIRIFTEIVYFYETKKGGVVVIDEIDEFLSVKNSGRILVFLRDKFTEINFIVTTHSADLIASAENANLILMYGENYEILDAGDFSSISQVYDIFNTLLDKSVKTDKQKRDEALRRLFNNRMSGIWGSEEKEELNEIRDSNLTKAQKLIVKQIEEWRD